jgi:predicted transcriptional regulator with HTH domain
MKKILLGIAILFSAIAYSTPNEKILKNFSDAFPKAENVTWYESENDTQVQFNSGKIKCKLWYDADGNVTKTNRYYTQESLSPFILARVQQKYNGKKIYGITEVSSDEGLNYFIILEDEKKWYHVTSDSIGNLKLEDKYNKA